MAIDVPGSDTLQSRERDLAAEYDQHRRVGMRLDLTRGKPSPDQLSLADGLEDTIGRRFVSDGIDVRNYGGLDGLPAARRLGAALLGAREDEVLVGGNASLTLMYQYVSAALDCGPLGPGSAWRDAPSPKFLCIVPGYDRHFRITEDLGLESVCVPMLDDGPDMDEVERLVSDDSSIKGIWCVPKYQNPTGHTFSDRVVERFSRLGAIAGPGFRIMWDNAYAVHDLYDEPDPLRNLMDLCRAAGTADSVVVFGSTSKITRAGSGISFLATSPGNLAQFKRRLAVQTIGPDKVTQLAHVRFLKDIDGIRAHMRRHATIVRPKFKTVLRHLEAGLSGVAHWTRPRGGYFISVDVPAGTASEAVRLSAEAGLKLTPAGATYPHQHDPHDVNIRLAPTYPTLDELEQAMPVFVTSVKLAAARLELKAMSS